jgi:putative oxidoreductase
MALTATTDHDARVVLVNQPLEVAGRILYGAPFAVFGAMHLAMGSAMAGAVPAFAPGGGLLWVYVTGIAMIAAAVSIVTNLLTRLSGILLAILLGAYVFALHLPPFLAGESMELQSILKNTALAGGALLVAARGR